MCFRIQSGAQSTDANSGFRFRHSPGDDFCLANYEDRIEQDGLNRAGDP